MGELGKDGKWLYALRGWWHRFIGAVRDVPPLHPGRGDDEDTPDPLLAY